MGENPPDDLTKTLENNDKINEVKPELKISGLPNACSEGDDPLFVKLFEQLVEDFEYFGNQNCMNIFKDIEFIRDYYYSICDGNNSILYGEKHLEISLNLFSLKSEQTANSLVHLAKSLRDLKQNYDEALKQLDKAKGIRQELFGKEHVLFACVLFETAMCYFRQENFKTSTEMHLQCLEIKKKVYGQNNPFLVFSLDRISKCYEKLGDYQKYLDYRNKALAIKRCLFKKIHTDCEYQDYFKWKNKTGTVSNWKVILIQNERVFQSRFKDFRCILKSN